jgi:hypothetical protein
MDAQPLFPHLRVRMYSIFGDQEYASRYQFARANVQHFRRTGACFQISILRVQMYSIFGEQECFSSNRFASQMYSIFGEQECFQISNSQLLSEIQ